MSCFVCEKHLSIDQNQILNINNTNDFIVAHCPDLTGTNEVYLGALVIEPKRHVKNWSCLNDKECIELSMLIKEVNRILYSHKKIEHVYTWIFGDAVEHMHIWVMPRYINTPKKFWGTKITKWPESKKGGLPEMAEMIREFQSLV